MRVVGWSFLALAAYVVVDAGHALCAREVPENCFVGLIMTILSVAIMPALARAKRRVAVSLVSRALTVT